MRGQYITGSRSPRFAIIIFYQILAIWTITGILDPVKGQQPVNSIFTASHQPAKLNRASAKVETAIRAPPSVQTYPARSELARQFSGGTAVGTPRSLQDWEVEDFVLLATVDGTLQARDRKTGTRKWELFSEQPVVETIYHRSNETKDWIPDDDFVWIVEPSEEGVLFRYHAELGLEKTEMTMKKLVERSPMSLHNSGRIYSGEKQTETYAIDGRTGDILRIFRTGGGAKMMVDTRRCKPSHTDDLEEDECDSKASDITILVARTVYTVTVEDVVTNELLWTLKYTEWGPNNGDLDLAAQYSESMDNRFIYAIHDGRILGFDRSRGGSLPVYTHVLNSPVARVFDVVRSASTDKSTFLVLPQPFVFADRPPQEQAKTFVGCTRGGWYALSEKSYPFVSERASPADCSMRKPQLANLPQSEKEKVLVGIHDTQDYTSLPGPASVFGQRHIAAPTEQGQEPPHNADSTDEPHPSSPSGTILRLGMTSKWNIAFALPLCLAGLMYLKWVKQPKYSLKWNFEAVKSGLIPVVTMNTKVRESPKLNDTPANILQGPSQNERVNNVIELEVPAGPKLAASAVVGGSIEPNDVRPVSVCENVLDTEVPVVDVTTIIQDTQASAQEEVQAPVLDKVREIQTLVIPEVMIPGVKAEKLPEVEQEMVPEARLEVEKLAPLETKLVRFQEERLQTPAPEPVEEVETPTLTTPTPKKKKAHRGQRGGKKKKANRAQQQENENEQLIGRIVDRAKDLQHSSNLEPDVEVLNDPSDIESDIIRIDNLIVHQDPQSTLGLGSQGTVVFKGKFEGRTVAVKRMLKTFFDVAHREVRLLQDSDDHPNVIRYHCMKELDQFLYIALEQCRGSLCDVIVDPKHEDLRNLLDPQQVLQQVVAGVNHLHRMKIVHRDLKPQNILVSEPKRFLRDPNKLHHPRILISDFGLCKQLEANQSSFRATTAHAAGTSGWRAPELLMDEGSDMRPFASSTMSETSGGSSTETTAYDGINRRATRAIDIFSMGCVFFFVLTQGGHPFGPSKYSRELNVVTGQSDLEPLEILGAIGTLAKDLIQRMIQRNPKARPDTTTILTHPYFWTAERRLLFLIDTSDRFEKEKDSEKDPKYKSPYIPILERDAKNIVKGDWLKRIEHAFYEEVMGNKRRGYDGEKVLDLLRVIRNKRNHYQDMTKAAQEALGSLPDGYLDYFERKFPDLFLHVYRVNVETGFALKDLRAYYTPVDC
ncbi:hypothetical protein BGX38DRAFT_1166071 [Terfezia claveryi]|nr:hypothetical protein BGX38DRAFT_1166071 [Terfezia claveryi]